MATANEQSDDVSILLGLGNGDFLLTEHLVVGDSPWSLTAADFDGDGFPDLATANRKSNTVSVLYGNRYGSNRSRSDTARGRAEAGAMAGRDRSPAVATGSVVNSATTDRLPVSYTSRATCPGGRPPASIMSRNPDTGPLRRDSTHGKTSTKHEVKSFPPPPTRAADDRAR